MILTIHIKLKWNLTIAFVVKLNLIFASFAIKYRGNTVFSSFPTKKPFLKLNQGEALRQGVVDCETFLKHVRKLSRRQFFLRATMNKCRQTAGLPC